MDTFDPASLQGQDVLLVAPHPDDEAAGCGGTAHLAAKAGARVLPVICTRGDGGIAGRPQDDIVAQRQDESRRGCERLGIEAPRFLGLRSAELRDDPVGAGRKLLELLDGRAFDTVLLPWPLERHDTHRASTIAALAAWPVKDGARWWGYGVWDALPASAVTVEIDVTSAREAKTRALSAHASQDEARPLAAALAARDLTQAALSRITGDEPRRAVERLLDLDDCARAAHAALQTGAGIQAVHQAMKSWASRWHDGWVASLW